MMCRKFAFCVISALIATLSLANAVESQVVTNTCGEYQSCKIAISNFSPKPKIAPSMSFRIAVKGSELSSCIDGSMVHNVDETVANCEVYVNSGIGKPRDRARALFMLGHAYMRTKFAFEGLSDLSSNKSVKTWNEAFAADPTYVDPLLSIARMYGLSGQAAETLEILEKAEGLAPHDWRVYTHRTIAFGGMNNLVEMLEQAEKALKINPKEPEVRRVYAGALKINGRLEEAAAQYLIAAETYDPKKDTSLEFMRDENAWVSLSEVYALLNKPALAAAAITKYIESNGSTNRHYSMFELRGGYFEKAGMYSEAAEDFKLAAAGAPPPFAQALNDKRAFVLAKAGKKGMASDDLHFTLEHGSIQSRLKLQVFLRNQGYSNVTINGRYDDATKEALESCLEDKSCAPGVGKAI
jgi:tetratricopeptide (TPR) repeat protein